MIAMKVTQTSLSSVPLLSKYTATPVLRIPTYEYTAPPVHQNRPNLAPIPLRLSSVTAPLNIDKRRGWRYHEGAFTRIGG